MSVAKTNLERRFELALASYTIFAVLFGLVNDMRIFPGLTNVINWIMIAIGFGLLYCKSSIERDNSSSMWQNISELSATRNLQKILLSLFLIVNIISILFNLEYDVWKNLQSISYMFVMFFLFYNPLNTHSNKNYFGKRMFSKLAVGTVTATFVLTLLSLFMYAFGIAYTVRDTYKIGFDIHSNRLWGVYNPNGGSLIALISSSFSLYLIHLDCEKYKKLGYRAHVAKNEIVQRNLSDKFKSTFLLTNIFCQYTYIILAQSRAVITVSYIFIFLVSSGFIFNCQMNKIKNSAGEFEYPDLKNLNTLKLKNLGIAILAALTIVSLLFYGNKLYSNMLSKVPSNMAGVRNHLFSLDEEPEQAKFFLSIEEMGKIGSGRKAESKKINKGSGRLLFWEETLELVQDSPVVGLSHDGLIKEIDAKITDKNIREHFAAGEVHSVIFSALGSSGILGLLLFVLFLFLQHLDIIQRFINEFNEKHYLSLEALILYAVLISILLVDFVESRILYNINYIAILYWIFAGELNARCKLAYSEELVSESYSEIKLT